MFIAWMVFSLGLVVVGAAAVGWVDGVGVGGGFCAGLVDGFAEGGQEFGSRRARGVMEETWGAAAHVGCSKGAGGVGLGGVNGQVQREGTRPSCHNYMMGLLLHFLFVCLHVFVFFNNYLAVLQLKRMHIIAMMLKCSFNN